MHPFPRKMHSGNPPPRSFQSTEERSKRQEERVTGGHVGLSSDLDHLLSRMQMVMDAKEKFRQAAEFQNKRQTMTVNEGETEKGVDRPTV